MLTHGPQKKTGQSGDKININQTTAESLVSGDSQATSALQYSEYTFSTEKTISGNGQTVVNVYFKRIVYQLEFDLNVQGSSVQTEMLHDGKVYKSSDKIQYILTAKDGQYIGDKWPTGLPEIVGDNPYDSKFQGWKTPSDASVAAAYVAPVDYFGSEFISTTPEKRKLTLGASFSLDLSEWTSHIYFESLEETEEIVENYFFELHRTDITNSSGAFNPALLPTPGYEYLLTEFGESNSRKVYYIRKSYNLSFNTQGGTFTGAGQTSEKKYEEKIAGPSDPTRDGYRFAGWYLDADYREKMNFDTFTMPDSDVTLFAKWESTQNTVRYFDGFGGTQLLQLCFSK